MIIFSSKNNHFNSSYLHIRVHLNFKATQLDKEDVETNSVSHGSK